MSDFRKSAVLVLPAPAKLNLFLKVVGKRADGFHELDTVMQKISLCDTVRLEATNSDTIELQLQQTLTTRSKRENLSCGIPADHNNLVWKAAEKLRAFAGNQDGVRITLTKRIPAQAGLGGGSSDAAVTLTGLNQLWKLGLNHFQLHKIAAELGSDIPFFVAPCSRALCAGRGEKMLAVTSSPLWAVVAKPVSGLSTAAVFSKCAVSAFLQSGKEVITALNGNALQRLKYVLQNGLQQPACELNPEVNELLERMQRMPFVCSLMSGSGTACFGLCRTHRQAIHLAAVLRGQGIDQVFVVRSRE